VGWERRGGERYYYTAKRVGGRVVKQYVGAGYIGELTAKYDAATRAERAADAEDDRQARDDLDAALDPLHDLADALTVAALVAAGFHRHHRGPWRKRRA
jgi:predicted phage gp36 major capsid-like protein